jgi:hypothetical protein
MLVYRCGVAQYRIMNINKENGGRRVVTVVNFRNWSWTAGIKFFVCLNMSFSCKNIFALTTQYWPNNRRFL